MFLGLCTLADWVGSNERWFPYVSEANGNYMEAALSKGGDAVAECGIDINRQRRAARERGAPAGFADLFGLASPNAIQQSVVETPLDERLVVVESETGSGKTEAALWRFAHLYEAELVDGLYFALPTRAAAVQIFERVRRFARSAFPAGHAPHVVLAVPGYIQEEEEDASSGMLPRYDTWDDSPGGEGSTLGRRERQAFPGCADCGGKPLTRRCCRHSR